MTSTTIDFESARSACELMGYGTDDYLRTWFAGVDADRGSILFVRRIAKLIGGSTFKAVKGFRPDQIEEAAEFISNFDQPDNLFIKTSTFNAAKITARMNRGETVVGNKNEVSTVCGVAVDVDAGKRDSYANQADVWQAIHQMPVLPTMVVLSGEADHGFHVYWKLIRPIPIQSVEDVELLNLRAGAWRNLLCDKVAEVLTERGKTDFVRDKLIDRVYGVDRVLRPVGAARASGAVVRLAAFNPERRYSLADLTVPGWQPPGPTGPSWPRAEESIIDRFFLSMQRTGKEITIAGLLTANGYSPLGNGDWVRGDSETGSRSVSEGDVINGLPGVNVFSGGCAPLKCNDDKNDVGRRYSLYALWVAFEFGDTDLQASWSAAAAYCHDQLKPTPEEVFTPIDPSEADAVVPQIANGDRIGNSVIPKSMNEIIRAVRDAYGEWPKACQGDLFVLDSRGKPRILDTSTKLFGWLNTSAQVVFHTNPSVIAKSEFFEQLAQYVGRCEAIETSPHFPPVEDHYYVCGSPEPGSGKTLERFLDFFAPASEQDRQLMLALVVTMFWGGAPGARPCFAVDATDGTGTGKSALAFKVGMLAGGVFQFDSGTNEDRIRTSLVSAAAAYGRMVILDNMKTTRISNATIEAMITAPTIGGHAMYRGARERPNHLAWCITMNGIQLSRDMAHRTVKIIVSKPGERKQWNAAIDRFIKLNREFIIADVAAFFERPTTDLKEYGRWSEWEHAVLSRLESPDELKALIKARAKDADEDESTAQGVIDYFEERLTDLKYDTVTEVVHIPMKVCADWASEATGRDLKLNAVGSMLTMLRESGSLKGMRPNPTRKYGRGWLWVGRSDGPGRTQQGPEKRPEATYDLEDRISTEGFDPPGRTRGRG